MIDQKRGCTLETLECSEAHFTNTSFNFADKRAHKRACSTGAVNSCQQSRVIIVRPVGYWRTSSSSLTTLFEILRTRPNAQKDRVHWQARGRPIGDKSFGSAYTTQPLPLSSVRQKELHSALDQVYCKWTVLT